MAARYGSGDLLQGAGGEAGGGAGGGAGPEGQCPPAHHWGSTPCSCQECSAACGCQLLLGTLHNHNCLHLNSTPDRTAKPQILSVMIKVYARNMLHQHMLLGSSGQSVQVTAITLHVLACQEPKALTQGGALALAACAFTAGNIEFCCVSYACRLQYASWSEMRGRVPAN